MRRFLKFGILAASTAPFLCTAQVSPETKTIGAWYDVEVLKCDISIEEASGKFSEVWRNCALSPKEVVVTPLRKIGPQSFKQSGRSWHYEIAASGDLQVRDSRGVVRIIESKGPRTLGQLKAKQQSQGVLIGMLPAEVLQSSWGKPSRVNRTTTANGVTEQWVYAGGYLYFKNGVLAAVQN